MLSRRNSWTSCLPVVIRTRFSPRTGLLDDLKKALSERILNAELDERLEDESTEGNVNRRKGHSRKSVLTGTSKMTLTIPRDRAGTFDPKLIAKYQRRFPDFDDKIISAACTPTSAAAPITSKGKEERMLTNPTLDQMQALGVAGWPPPGANWTNRAAPMSSAATSGSA